jgi:hypothetical protein
MSLPVPSIDVGEVVKGNYINFGSRLINSVLKKTQLYKIDDDVRISRSKNDPNELVLDDITMYDNAFYSITEDKKTNMMVLRTQSKKLFTCFEPRNERIQVRTLQQKLADVTTTEIIRSFTDKQYMKIFVSFYKTMNRILIEYCKTKGYSPDKDIVFFYKGGNVFRILLNELANILDNEEYKFMMKRSDADFQIFINPSLDNVDIVRRDVAHLTVFVLEQVRDYIRKSKVTQFSKNMLETIKEQYAIELQKHKVDAGHVFLIYDRDASRKDILIDMDTLLPQKFKEDIDANKNTCVKVRYFSSLIKELVPHKTPQGNTYFISYNKMLDFERKDNLKATFELIRLRRNFKLEVYGKNQDKSFVNVPLEIIDVSIPHGKDYGLKKLATGNLDVLVHTYTFKHTEEGRKTATTFTFKAPSLQYQLKDLHDLLFYQNEYPWYDMKYEKRMIRYFLTLFLYQLVEEITKRGHKNEMKNVLEIIRDDYFKIIQIFKTCVDNNGVPTSRVSNANTMSSLKTTWLNLLYEEYLKIFDRISKKTQEDVPKNVMMEMTRLKKFLKNIINMFEKMLMDIEKLLQHYADSQTRMHDFYDRLFVRGQTDIL